MQHCETNTGYIIRLEKGERVIETLTQFCREQGVASGFLHGLGAVEQATIGYYDLAAREYVFKDFDELMEVTSMTGNVALVDGDQFLHIHTVLGCQDWSVVTGHVKEMTVGVTLEVFITGTDVSITRKYDEETGLKLFDI